MDRILSRIKVWFALVLCGSSGCVWSLPFVHPETEPPGGQICQLVAIWNNEVAMAPDPTKNGKPAPGIAGRLYLFGETVDFPRTGTGSLTIDLFDASRKEGENSLVPLERWNIDQMTMRRLLKRDMIGWGYTIFLPWGTYRPDLAVTNVVLKVRYDPPNGSPIYTENPLTLNRPGGNNTRRTQKQLPPDGTADGKMPAAKANFWPPEPLPDRPNAPVAKKLGAR